MITVVRRVTSETPAKQIWKFLRYFLDTDFVSDEIRRVQGIPRGTHDSNIKKQARQLAYCIRQAEEYFEASRSAGLATRPVLLYYGAVSLSRALVLLRQDGTHSFDALRRSGKHAHHGLVLDQGRAANIKPERGPAPFFESTECRCHVQSESPGGPKILWGNFGLFYRSLVPGAIQVSTNVRDEGKTGHLETVHPQAVADLLPIESLLDARFKALELMRTLPDLYWPLMRDVNIRPGLCRGNVRKDQTRSYGEREPGVRQVIKVRDEHHFFIDGLKPDEKARLLESYRERLPTIQLVDDYGANIYLREVHEYEPWQGVQFYYPDLVDDLSGKPFYILRPEAYLPEPATFLIILFCLSMLARYYPDIWMKAIDSSPRIADLTDSLLDVAYRKFPNLILDQLTWTKHLVEAG